MKRIVFYLLLLIGQFYAAQTYTEAFLDIRKFGVKGDGKYDDSETIQRAIDYCEDKSIKTLVIPNGTYFLKKPVVFRKGGVQIVGTGALLREESWAKGLGRNNEKNEPFLGCTFIIPKNSIGFLFDSTVTDPVKISNIQFLAKEGRKVGSTTAIQFSSEFQGPVWPFVVESCNFRGFNYAIKFQSENQYNVAFVKITDNGFSQNDECVYFSDIPASKITNIGTRNLTWGFTFEHNKCHDNSRVIRGCFAKDVVNIRYNNMEGNIPYANGDHPANIVDLEVSKATINFEGNHFEAIISDAVSVSSAFRRQDGTYYEYSGKTTADETNKIFIKGNNFDGVNPTYKPYILKAMNVFNYDNYKLYLDECDIRENFTNRLNLYLSENALAFGTTIKTPYGKYDSTYRTLDYYSQVKTISVKMSSDKVQEFSALCNQKFNKIDKRIPLYKNPNESIKVEKSQPIVGASFLVNNPNTSDFFGQILFEVSYDNGKTYKPFLVKGTYGSNIGFSMITGFLPLNFSTREKNALVKASLITDIIGDSYVYIAEKYNLFSLQKANDVFAIPAYSY